MGTIPSEKLPPANPLGIDRSKLQNFVNLAILRQKIQNIGIIK